MPISRENNLIFVHIPKNAGTSIQEKFKMEQAGGHQTAEQMRTENPQLWKDYSSFCVVRNPWDRMVSNYYYCLAEKSFWFDVNNITRDNWDTLSNIKNSLIYNCTPVSDLVMDSNVFIDCIVTKNTGLKLANMQASHQFNLYTQHKFKFPWNKI